MALVQLVQGRATKALEMANDSLEVAKQIFSLNSPEVTILLLTITIIQNKILNIFIKTKF